MYNKKGGVTKYWNNEISGVYSVCVVKEMKKKGDAGLHWGFFMRGNHTGLITVWSVHVIIIEQVIRTWEKWEWNEENKADAGLHWGFFMRGSHTGLICRPQSRFEVFVGRYESLPGPSSSINALLCTWLLLPPSPPCVAVGKRVWQSHSSYSSSSQHTVFFHPLSDFYPSLHGHTRHRAPHTWHLSS